MQLSAQGSQQSLHTRSRLGLPERAAVGQQQGQQQEGQRSEMSHHSQRSAQPPFVRQAAPMVLCLDDITQSSDEVLAMEVKRTLGGLPLEELKRLNAML